MMALGVGLTWIVMNKKVGFFLFSWFITFSAHVNIHGAKNQGSVLNA